jgi:hypothetical protein
MSTDEAKRLAILATFLRVYGVLSVIIFGSLIIGFAVQTPLLADDPKGALNWVIWNGIRCGNEPCHVPPCCSLSTSCGLCSSSWPLASRWHMCPSSALRCGQTFSTVCSWPCRLSCTWAAIGSDFLPISRSSGSLPSGSTSGDRVRGEILWSRIDRLDGRELRPYRSDGLSCAR